MQYNKRYFFKDIITLVFLSHIFLLAIVFLYDSGKFMPERFVINPQKVQSTIVFIPLKKHVEQPVNKTSGTLRKSGKRQVIDYDKYQKKLAKHQVKKEANKKNKKVVLAKSSIQPVASKIQPVSSSFASNSANILMDQKATADNKKKAATSIKSEISKKKPEIKKITPKKVIVPEKKNSKKIEEKPKKVEPNKKEVVKRIEEKKIESVAIEQVIIPDSVQQQIVQEVVVEEKVQEPVSLPVTQLDLDSHEDDLLDVTFVGSHDLEMLELQEQIKAQVAEHYKPPVGISKKAICELAVVVGMDGKPQRVTVKKGSGSMANDLCARAALLKIIFPKKVFGKEIIVELGQ